MAVGAAANVATFITNFGLGGLLDIRAAKFEGYLNATSGGRVLLDIDLSFMNEPKSFTLDFNFQDPMSAVKGLASQLLPALPG